MFFLFSSAQPWIIAFVLLIVEDTSDLHETYCVCVCVPHDVGLISSWVFILFYDNCNIILCEA